MKLRRWSVTGRGAHFSFRLGLQAPQGDAPFEEGHTGVGHVSAVGNVRRDRLACAFTQGRVVRKSACLGQEIFVAGEVEHVAAP